jgi:hypothetical protein
MRDSLPPLPSLLHNGADNPSTWRPDLSNLRRAGLSDVAEEGDLVGWRYGGWRVIEAKAVPEVDLTEDEHHKLHNYLAGIREEVRPRVWMNNRPRIVVLRHEHGPLIINPGEKHQRLHDGATTVHFRSEVLAPHGFYVLKEPFRVCSCHGHIWPCQEIDQAAVAAHQSRRMDRLMATTQPGVCANCLEAITTRQKTVTFPEPSRFMPGAPGPTFHAGRAVCWQAAEDYERGGRLADDPDVTRIASCPGIRFMHERHGMPTEQRLECTAGPFCTGLHGPPGNRHTPPCWFGIQLAGNDGTYARPSIDCGYAAGDRRCLGGDLTGGGTMLSPIAADLLWRAEQRRRGHSGF